MKILKKENISIFVTVILLVWIVYFVHNHWEAFQKVRLISWKYALALILLAFIDLLVKGYIFKSINMPFNINLKFIEWFGIKTVQLMSSYIVPYGGIGIRITYLKKKYNLSYADNLSSVAVVFIVESLVFAFGGIISLVYLYLKDGLYDNVLTIGLVMIFLLICSINLFKPFKIKSENRFFARINSLQESWHRMKVNSELTKRIITITTMEFFVVTLLFYYSYKAFGLEISFMETFLVVSLSNLSLYFRVTPASIGTYEAAVIYPTVLFGLTVYDGLIIVAIRRLVTMFWYFSLGPAFSYILMKRL